MTRYPIKRTRNLSACVRSDAAPEPARPYTASQRPRGLKPAAQHRRLVALDRLAVRARPGVLATALIAVATSSAPASTPPSPPGHDASADGSVASAPAEILFYHTDHLGSTSVTTDANGEVVSETLYCPFGTQRHEHSTGAPDPITGSAARKGTTRADYSTSGPGITSAGSAGLPRLTTGRRTWKSPAPTPTR